MPDMNIAAVNSGNLDGDEPNPVRQFLESLSLNTNLVPSEFDPDVDDILVSAYVDHYNEMTEDQRLHVASMAARFSNWRNAVLDKMLSTK